MVQVLLILTKKVKQPGTISFGVPLGINQQKSAQKSIKYRNIDFEYFYSIVKLRANFCWLMKHT